MESNTYKIESEPVKKQQGKKGRVSQAFSDLLNGNILVKDFFLNNLPFVLFLFSLGIGYVAYGYHAEKTVRDLYKAEAHLKELKSEYLTNKSELMVRSNQSEVAASLINSGLYESRTPPKKIVVSKKEYKKQSY
ncbi:MAG: FtsL-like putative cell division protein [Luteibaculaceae bacterium]